MIFQQTFSKLIYTALTHIMSKKCIDYFLAHWSKILLGLAIFSYISYFSYFSIIRYQTLYAHYFDLGIMNQTVYNSYMAIKTGDYSRFLELTNPHGFDQIKRMAVHNDMFLAALAPFYFIYTGPETLLVIQSIALGLGALAVYGISEIVFKNFNNKRLISLFFAFAYLMNPSVQHTNQFDFHAVVLATPLLLFMFLFYLNKKYWASIICALCAILTKEQVGLTIAFFGIFVLLQNLLSRDKNQKKLEFMFSIPLICLGAGWFVFSMTKIIPFYRHGLHFALGYFGDFGDSTVSVFIGIIKNPLIVFQYIFRKDTYEYLYDVLGPFGFISFFSPLHLFIAAPEFAINLLSKSGAMRNIYYHYTAVITPFVVISAIYGFRFFIGVMKGAQKYSWLFIAVLIVCTFYFSDTLSPLPLAVRQEVLPFTSPLNERFDASIWQKKLSNEKLKIMTSGRIAPLFTSRRYFYTFSNRYDLADYVVLSRDDVYNGYENELSKPAYEKLIRDPGYMKIYINDTFEVYKKI
jgi:uncharacterized membrane protein